MMQATTAAALPPSNGGLRQHPLLALEQLSAQCNEELQELRLICDQVCSRLTVLVNHLEDATQRRKEPSIANQYAPALEMETTWSTRVGEIITQFSAFVDRNARHNTIRRLTDVYRLRELYELQIEIDNVFRSTRTEHVDVAQNWQFQWQKDAEYVEQQLQLAVNDQEVLCRELQTPDVQREALALVKFAAESTQSNNQEDVDDHDAQYAATRLGILRKVFRALLSISEVDVPAIPEWFISPNDVATQSVPFVSGASTSIHFGKWLPLNNQPVIVKRATHQSLSDSDEEFFMREANLWYPLNHPNVLKMVGGWHVSTPRLLVFECLVTTEIQTLDEYISGPAANKRKLFRLLHQAAMGLKYLHEQHHIVHNDLKCRNILVSHDGKAKVCNFFGSSGNSKDFSVNSTEKDLHLLNQIGSLRWVAPEALLGNDSIGRSADIYGFGMCILEAVSGDTPWGFADEKTIRQRVLRGELPTRPASVEDEVWALITRMCAFDQTTRPDIAFVTESLRNLAEKESGRDHSDSMTTSRVNGTTLSQRMSYVNPADYSKHHQQLSRSRGSFSDTRSMSSTSSSTFSKDEQRPEDAVSVVVLHQKWLGVKINSIGTKIVISKFLRSSTGAMGEIEASGSVQLGDIIYAVNNQSVRGMNRHQIGSFIQSTPRPMQLSFKREAALLDDCFRFHGLRIEERWRDRGSALSLPGSLDRMFGSTTGCFSFETWFSLADVPDTFLGGILLGAQDSSVDDNSWPYIHRQVVVIDSHGNLCCSLLNTDTPALIAKELAPNNWYHLVVTYNSNNQQLLVYLDGEMRYSASGPLHREWARLTHANIGSGCISGISPAKPSPDFTGWYGFNGLISDFKIWRTLLTDLEVQQLFRGAAGCVDIPSYSMKRDIRKKSMTGAQNPERVRASRPQHVVAQVY